MQEELILIEMKLKNLRISEKINAIRSQIIEHF